MLASMNFYTPRMKFHFQGHTGIVLVRLSKTLEKPSENQTSYLTHTFVLQVYYTYFEMQMEPECFQFKLHNSFTEEYMVYRNNKKYKMPLSFTLQIATPSWFYLSSEVLTKAQQITMIVSSGWDYILYNCHCSSMHLRCCPSVFCSSWVICMVNI